MGVHVREYGTVITTDNIVNAGFADLSLHPLRLSLVGCVIARGTAYHDNVSTHGSVTSVRCHLPQQPVLLMFVALTGLLAPLPMQKRCSGGHHMGCSALWHQMRCLHPHQVNCSHVRGQHSSLRTYVRHPHAWQLQAQWRHSRVRAHIMSQHLTYFTRYHHINITCDSKLQMQPSNRFDFTAFCSW